MDSSINPDPFQLSRRRPPVVPTALSAAKQLDLADPAAKAALRTHLTYRDIAMIEYGTQSRIDVVANVGPAVASAVAADRAGGRLRAGQPLTMQYLRDLKQRLSAHVSEVGQSPIVRELSAAIERLTGSKFDDGSFDVNA